MKLIFFALAFLLIPHAQIGPASTVVARDGFESATLSSDWDTWRFVPGDVQMETHTARAGRQAVQITVHAGDVYEHGVSGDADSERAELTEARRLTSHENVPYEFKFSLYFPANFPIVPVRLVVAQWKQACITADKVPETTGPCYDDSPVLALRYIGGELRITQDLQHRTIVLWRDKREFRRRWIDFRFQVRFTPGSSGRVKAWINNREVVNYTGATSNPDTIETGYPDPSFIYFKMGLYRNAMKDPMTIYIDEYRKRQFPSD